jgi:hypothetical protein
VIETKGVSAGDLEKLASTEGGGSRDLDPQWRSLALELCRTRRTRISRRGEAGDRKDGINPSGRTAG